MQIEAALASAAVWDDAGSLWEALQTRLKGHSLTRAAFEAVLSSRTPQPHVPDDAPVWEREHLQSFLEADRREDWVALGKLAQAFQRLPCPDLCARQATLALSVLDWPRLVRLADKTQGWLQGHLLMASLPLADALRLATASRSDHMRFTALERLVGREVRNLLPEEVIPLRNLLLVLAKDENNWPNWLSLCNRYPVRHPHIQVALGLALARGDGKAFQAYISSIYLSGSDADGRECVSRCLAVFRSQAGITRRRTLWRMAFERWDTWDFAAAEKRELTALARSALDYGAVGWLIEGVGRERSTDLDKTFEEALRALDMQWHASLTLAISAFHRLVSRHQVLAHARDHLGEGFDWLPGPSIHLPAAAKDRFIQQRYHWNDP